MTGLTAGNGILEEIWCRKGEAVMEESKMVDSVEGVKLAAVQVGILDQAKH